MNYKFFAWLNVVLLVIQLAPYLLVRLNKEFLKTKNKTYLTLTKGLRKYHKQTGALLLVTGIIHGYLALGGQLRLHTGTILYLAIVLSAILGFGFFKKKQKQLLKVHRTMALLIVLLFLIHFLTPNLMSDILNSMNPQ